MKRNQHKFINKAENVQEVNKILILIGESTVHYTLSLSKITEKSMSRNSLAY